MADRLDGQERPYSMSSFDPEDVVFRTDDDDAALQARLTQTVPVTSFRGVFDWSKLAHLVALTLAVRWTQLLLCQTRCACDYEVEGQFKTTMHEHASRRLIQVSRRN